MSPSPQQLDVLICCSHEDQLWADLVLGSLRSAVESVTVWDDRRIVGGSEWQHEFDDAINNAKVAIFLISPNFFASEFFSEYELPDILEAAQSRGLAIFPIHVAPSAFELTSIGRLPFVNSPSRCLGELRTSERDSIFVEIGRRIQEALHQDRLASHSRQEEDSALGDIVSYAPTLMRLAHARAKRFGAELHRDTSNALESLLKNSTTSGDLIAEFRPYPFEIPIAKSVPHPKFLKVRSNRSRRAVRKVASTNVRIFVDKMYAIHRFAAQQASEYENPHDVIKPAALTSMLSWLCPIWPIC